MYVGALGMKHNPEMLLQLALHFQEDRKSRRGSGFRRTWSRMVE